MSNTTLSRTLEQALTETWHTIHGIYFVSVWVLLKPLRYGTIGFSLGALLLGYSAQMNEALALLLIGYVTNYRVPTISPVETSRQIP